MSDCLIFPSRPPNDPSQGVKLDTYVKIGSIQNPPPLSPSSPPPSQSDQHSPPIPFPPPVVQLPIATEDSLGVVKVGEGLIVDKTGVLSLDPDNSCDCKDDDGDEDLDLIHYLDGGSAAGL